MSNVSLGGATPRFEAEVENVAAPANAGTAAGVEGSTACPGEVAGIGFGARGPEVAKLQSDLHAAGFNPGTIDGMFGRGTERALIAFQQRSGLEASGRADPNTLEALGKAVAAAPTVTLRSEEGMGVPLYATVDGKERKLTDDSWGSFSLEGGRLAAWKGSDGAGGYENEGQSLHIFDPKSGESRKVMSEYVMIDDVTTARSANGDLALLVQMSDGGLGGPHFGLVDPERGQVFRQPMARLIEAQGDRIKLAVFDDEEAFLEDKPSRVETHSIRELLKNEVIVNPHSHPVGGVESIRLDGEGWFGKPLYATIDGEEKHLTDDAVLAFNLEGTGLVAWSGVDGAGGFEGEGQSLSVYDANTGETRKVMAEYFMIDDVTAMPTSDGDLGLLVQMSDGGAGLPHFGVVDPDRGQVFKLVGAKLLKQEGDEITVGMFREGDEKPSSYRTFDLKKILQGDVIENPLPDWE